MSKVTRDLEQKSSRRIKLLGESMKQLMLNFALRKHTNTTLLLPIACNMNERKEAVDRNQEKQDKWQTRNAGQS